MWCQGSNHKLAVYKARALLLTLALQLIEIFYPMRQKAEVTENISPKYRVSYSVCSLQKKAKHQKQQVYSSNSLQAKIFVTTLQAAMNLPLITRKWQGRNCKVKCSGRNLRERMPALAGLKRHLEALMLPAKQSIRWANLQDPGFYQALSRTLPQAHLSSLSRPERLTLTSFNPLTNIFIFYRNEISQIREADPNITENQLEKREEQRTLGNNSGWKS